MLYITSTNVSLFIVVLSTSGIMSGYGVWLGLRRNKRFADVVPYDQLVLAQLQESALHPQGKIVEYETAVTEWYVFPYAQL